MAIYIIRPKKSLLGRFPGLAARNISAGEREAQIEEVAQLWQEDQTYRAVREWIDEAGDYVRPITTNFDYPTLTGTTLVEMSEEEAERMGRELPKDVAILEDRPIELIRPIQDAATAKDILSAGDIWHLQAIARSKSGKKGQNVKIAVFDTGIEANHPEIRGKVAESYFFNPRGSAGPAIEEAAESEDTDGHGTHVAGLICGKTAGVAPEAELINVTMIPKRLGSFTNFAIALEWLLWNRPDIRIVNISAGISARYREQMSDVIYDLLLFGILPICAIGNEGRDITRSPGNCQGVLSVGATNRNGEVWGSSSSATMIVNNHQYNVPSLVAPGAEVYSSVMGGGYQAWSGTSMATPIVSGIAALILEENPDIPGPDLKEALLGRCQTLVGQLPERQGQGLIQVAT